MIWKLRYSKKAERQLEKLDAGQRRIIVAWLKKHLNGCEDPRVIGKPLGGDWRGFWRYRIGSYRLICKIEDKVLKVLAISIGHRSVVYTHRG